jgi:hypothetical protein
VRENIVKPTWFFVEIIEQMFYNGQGDVVNSYNIPRIK